MLIKAKMRGKSILCPSLLRQAFSLRYISSSASRIPLNRSDLLSTSGKNHSIPKSPFFVSTLQNPNLSRPFSDSASFVFKPSFAEPEPAPVPENVIRVSSEEEFNAALLKTEEESASAVFYFTATYSKPCLFIGPIVDEMARRTPDVIIYKMDIDEEHIASRIKELNVTSVPTLHYFKEGKKVDEVVGGNATRMYQAMRDLYNMWESKPEDSQEEVKEEIDAADEKVDAEYIQEQIKKLTLLMQRIHRRKPKPVYA